MVETGTILATAVDLVDRQFARDRRVLPLERHPRTPHERGQAVARAADERLLAAGHGLVERRLPDRGEGDQHACDFDRRRLAGPVVECSVRERPRRNDMIESLWSRMRVKRSDSRRGTILMAIPLGNTTGSVAYKARRIGTPGESSPPTGGAVIRVPSVVQETNVTIGRQDPPLSGAPRWSGVSRSPHGRCSAARI
jgi:hypothetical protein